jgi:hypothetical protein
MNIYKIKGSSTGNNALVEALQKTNVENSGSELAVSLKRIFYEVKETTFDEIWPLHIRTGALLPFIALYHEFPSQTSKINKKKIDSFIKDICDFENKRMLKYPKVCQLVTTRWDGMKSNNNGNQTALLAGGDSVHLICCPNFIPFSEVVSNLAKVLLEQYHGCTIVQCAWVSSNVKSDWAESDGQIQRCYKSDDLLNGVYM